jgi:MFS family permease
VLAWIYRPHLDLKTISNDSAERRRERKSHVHALFLDRFSSRFCIKATYIGLRVYLRVLMTKENKPSVSSIKCLTFFLADVQTGLGPFLAAYLATNGWTPARVGYALTFGGLVTVATQTPAGALIDSVRRKRALMGTSLTILVAGALLLVGHITTLKVYLAQLFIGGSGAFLAPLVTAITLGVVGTAAFDRVFGEIQAFNSAGNVFTALLVAYISYRFGFRLVFVFAAVLAIPAAIALSRIRASDIDYSKARGAVGETLQKGNARLSVLLQDRTLIAFLCAAFLFHLANAAMLPELGELLSKDSPKTAGAFMSACVIVTQVVITLSAVWIGQRAATHGRKPLLLLGFGVLPIRAVLYTLTHLAGALIAIQILDGIANAVFGIVSILVVKDRTRGTGRFNLAAGALATMVGIGAALSNSIGGFLVQRFSYRSSFLGLSLVALAAFAVLWVLVPETLPHDGTAEAPSQAIAIQKEEAFP